MGMHDDHRIALADCIFAFEISGLRACINSSIMKKQFSWASSPLTLQANELRVVTCLKGKSQHASVSSGPSQPQGVRMLEFVEVLRIWVPYLTPVLLLLETSIH